CPTASNRGILRRAARTSSPRRSTSASAHSSLPACTVDRSFPSSNVHLRLLEPALSARTIIAFPVERPERPASIHCLHDPRSTLRLLVAAGLLALGQLDPLARQLLIRSLLEQVSNEVEARPLLVVAVHDEPGSVSGIGRRQHIVARARIV